MHAHVFTYTHTNAYTHFSFACTIAQMNDTHTNILCIQTAIHADLLYHHHRGIFRVILFVSIKFCFLLFFVFFFFSLLLSYFPVFCIHQVTFTCCYYSAVGYCFNGININYLIFYIILIILYYYTVLIITFDILY